MTLDPIASLISAFTKFPGVGNKSARRMVFYLLKRDPAELEALGERIASLKNELCTCSKCGNISANDPCPICQDKMRDRSTICVVEEVEDLVSFEQAGIYNGLYHVLGSRVSPFEDEELSAASVDFLLEHILSVNAKEIIIATNPRMEGDLTYYTLLDVLKDAQGLGKIDKNLRVSRLAFGLPVGGSIEFADRMTLHAALESRSFASLAGFEPDNVRNHL